MPAALERRLKRQAKKKGFTKKKDHGSILTERGRAYVYGRLRKTGWRPSHQHG